MAKRPSKKKTDESPLLAALKFIAPASADAGLPTITHCRIDGGQIVGFNGILSAGHPYISDDQLFPHTGRLLAAISKATGPYSITHMSDGQLAIKTDKFRALVPCVDAWQVEPVKPDPPAGPMDEAFRTALIAAGAVAQEGATTIIEASILCRQNSCVGTNRRAVLEAWHGLNMPTMIVPKAFAALLAKVGKDITAFGFSDVSLTIYFADDSWLKTQLYVEKWPDVDRVLRNWSSDYMADIPGDFFEAIKSVKTFNDDDYVYISGANVRSHAHENVGAAYRVDGINGEGKTKIKDILVFENLATQIDLNSRRDMFFFAGDKFRGILAKSA